MVRFSLEEKRDMYEMYIRYNRNSLEASRQYRLMFPDRIQPSRWIFHRLAMNMAEFGALAIERHNNYRRGPDARRNVNTINVLAQIHINPENSIRPISRECGISKSEVQRIIKEHKYHDYKFRPVQKLHPGDSERRLNFCNWFRGKLNEEPNFARKILWSDESTFTNSGMFNRKNKHYYATENPHLMMETRPQVRFSINVWCGLFDMIE